jgi:hypothetical protein
VYMRVCIYTYIHTQVAVVVVAAAAAGSQWPGCVQAEGYSMEAFPSF